MHSIRVLLALSLTVFSGLLFRVLCRNQEELFDTRVEMTSRALTDEHHKYEIKYSQKELTDVKSCTQKQQKKEIIINITPRTSHYSSHLIL